LNNASGIAIISQNDGGILVVMPNQIATLNFSRKKELIGKPIRVTEAAKKYGTTQANLSHWASKGLIRIVRRAPKLLELDEADVHLAVNIFNAALEQTENNHRQAGWVLKRAIKAMPLQ